MIQKNRMYRISDDKVKDGLFNWLFGGNEDGKKKKRKHFEDLDEGDKIIFKRASGSKDYGVVQSVFKNLGDKGIEYGVKVKGSKDNIVVPEEKITEVEDSVKPLAEKRMYRKSS